MDFQKEDGRIFVQDEEGKQIAEVTFPLIDGCYHLHHTFVDASLQGQGIASKLVEMVMEEAKATHTKVYITCSYALNWIQKHDAYQDLWISSI